MKKIIIIIHICLCSVNYIQAQIFQVNSWYDGFWGDWHYLYGYTFKGDCSGYILHHVDKHPSEYVFKFNIDSFVMPDKKTRKKKYREGTWYEYTGTVEYYVTESYPSITNVLRKFRFPCINCKSNEEACVKRVAKAIIKVAPYKKYPYCYNIYFDEVAVGLSTTELFVELETKMKSK